MRVLSLIFTLMFWAVLGVVLGIFIPLPVQKPEVRVSEVHTRLLEAPPDLINVSCPELDPDEELLVAEVAAAEEDLARSHRDFEVRWGKPIEPPEVISEHYQPERLRQQIFDRIPGVRWAEVDCSFWPCMGMVVYEDKGVDVKEIIAQAGGNVGGYGGYNLPNAIDDLQLLGFGFYEGEPDKQEKEWIKLLYGRMLIQNEDDIGIVSSNEALAE